MSDEIREECGLALIRLRKPLSYYQEKYGTALWGFYKLFLLMEKQHNRGQDGAGVGALKLCMKPGEPYIFRERQIESNPLDRIFNKLLGRYNEMKGAGLLQTGFAASVKKHFEFGAEIYIGHLRYGTFGGYIAVMGHAAAELVQQTLGRKTAVVQACQIAPAGGKKDTPIAVGLLYPVQLTCQGVESLVP